MDQYQLSILSEKLKIAPEHIIREFYEIVLLQTFSESNLTKDMIFYGGTALRLAYNGPRFSEDLDFLMIRPISSERLKKALQIPCRLHPELLLREVQDKRYTLFAIIQIKHPFLKHHRHIKIEISKQKNGIQAEYRLLHSECSHLTPLIQVITLPSLETLKIQAIKEREEPRDWLDLWVISNFLRKPLEIRRPFPFVPSEFKREMRRFLPRDKWPLIDQIIKIFQT